MKKPWKEMSTWVMNLKMVLSRVPSEKGFLSVMR